MKRNKSLRFSKVLQAALAIMLLFAFSQCSYEPEISTKPVSLTFSTDTIQFDTLFTGRQSITKRLKIYNNSNNAIALSTIQLNEESQDFQLYVNGVSGTAFKNEILLAEDSLLVLIEANIDQSDQNNPFVMRDYLTVENGGLSQAVVVEAWGQNAHYLNDSILSCNTVWTADKPYVITNSILVEAGCTLTIKAGTKIYSGRESLILINGSLNAIGNQDSLIVFTNDRLDEPYSSTPGQWGGIVILEESTNNSVSYTEVKNGSFGFNIATYSPDGQVDLFLDHVKVGNMVGSAVLSLNSDFEAVNSIFYNTSSATCTHIGGGSASYTHCTIANYFPAQRKLPALYFSDSAIDNDENEIISPMQVNLINCIGYGRLNDEIFLSESVANNLTFTSSHCILKSTQAAFDVNNNLLNQDPQFIDPFDGFFQLGKTSPAISNGISTSITDDFLGTLRDDKPDIGAYEFQVSED